MLPLSTTFSPEAPPPPYIWWVFIYRTDRFSKICTHILALFMVRLCIIITQCALQFTRFYCFSDQSRFILIYFILINLFFGDGGRVQFCCVVLHFGCRPLWSSSILGLYHIIICLCSVILCSLLCADLNNKNIEFFN